MTHSAHITYPISGVPRGMFASVPPTSIEPGGMQWVENYLMWEGGFKTRNGFEKHNIHAIPAAGLRLDGATQYVEIKDGDAAEFTNDSTKTVAFEIAFMIEAEPALNERGYLVYRGSGVAGEETWSAYVLNDAGVLQIGLEVGGVTGKTAFAASDQLKPGVGYRVTVYEGTGSEWILILYGDGVGRVTKQTFTLSTYTGTGTVLVGRSLRPGLPGYFGGIVQDFRYWVVDGTAATIDESVFDLNHDTELRSGTHQNLRAWVMMNESSESVMEDRAGSGYDGLLRPGLPTWVAPGMVDNTTVTAAISLDPVQQHRIEAFDYPAGIGGGSLFERVATNSSFEFTYSIAARIDSDYIDDLAAAGNAPDYLPLGYLGNRGSDGLGADVGVTGEWAFAFGLENVGTVSAPIYKPRLFCHDEDNTVHQILLGSAFTKTITPGADYRFDVIRDDDKFFIRSNRDGEASFSILGEQVAATVPAIQGKELYSGPWTDGLSVPVGASKEGVVERFFPGVVDDVRLFSANAELLGAEYSVAQLQWSGMTATHPSLVLYLKLSEGSGEFVVDSSSWDNNLSGQFATRGEYHRLQPSTNLQPTHGAGWVKPSRLIPASGIHAYRDIESGAETIFVVGGGALWVSSAGFSGRDRRYRPIYHGIVGDNPMRFAHVNNQLVMADGRNRNLRYDGKSLSYLGLPEPTVAPAVTAIPSGSVLAGTFQHVYTYRNSKIGSRSNPSPAATTTTTASSSFSVQITTPNAGNDPLEVLGIDEVEIWRTQNAGATYYLVGRQKLPVRDGTQSVGGGVMPPFSDNVPDANLLSPDFLSSLSAYSPLPKVRVLISAKGRLFGLGTDRYPNRVLWTELHNPDHHDPVNQISDGIDSGDGDEITGAAYTNDMIYVFQRRSIWVIQGFESDTTIRIHQLYRGVGAVEHRTIQVIGGTIIFRSEENYYRLDAGSSAPQPIGVPIKSLLALSDPSMVRYETSGILQRDGVYLSAVTSEIGRAVNSETRNDYIFAVNVFTGAWSIWSLPGLAAFASIGFGGYSELYALMRSGFVMRYTGVGDDTQFPGTRKISYADGIAGGFRTRFTVADQVDPGDTYIDVSESDLVDTAGDAMKGCLVRYRLADGRLSRAYTIRKQASQGAGLRLHLTTSIQETDSAPAGLIVLVGGYTRRLLTPELTFGDPHKEATADQLSIVGSARAATPAPSCKPTVNALSGSSSLTYSYAYVADGREGALSPLSTHVAATRIGTTVEVEAPSRDIGSALRARVYLLIAGVHGHRLIQDLDMADYRGGDAVTWTDDGNYVGDPAFILHDPETGNAMIEVKHSARIRGGEKEEKGSLEVDLSGDREWRIPFRCRGSSIELDITSAYPGADHAINHMALLMEGGTPVQ